VQGEADLFEVVLALGPRGSGPDFLDGGQEQADQDGDDGGDHQQFDQGEATAWGFLLLHGHLLLTVISVDEIVN
jgi:hypothetical protein